MQVIVQHYGSPVPSGSEALVLEVDDWDDFGYRTSYHLWYRTPTDTWNLGPVKIAVPRQKAGAAPFERGRFDDGLPGEFFSLGQSDSYYDEISKLGGGKRAEILEALCDLAYFPNRLQDVKRHRVTEVSLLRSVEEQTVRAQFNRIARGGVRLTEYRFRYNAPGQATNGVDFQVVPESSPSSNVHVLIGRNGVGKTTLLRNLAGAVAHPDLDGRFGSVDMLPRLPRRPVSSSPTSSLSPSAPSTRSSTSKPLPLTLRTLRPGRRHMPTLDFEVGWSTTSPPKIAPPCTID
ncbi:hypothetical protein ACIO3R_32595 [Streptomyces sp. NPDC087428]|uniref:hypothetical protein n=1 Tax=Streptomyces sp. NPDC087428 TaxID=3365788 RepID=UPI003807AAE8